MNEKVEEKGNPISDAEWEGWPVIFPVCKRHKDELFKDYDNAVVKEDELCVVCYPRDNDSLGG